MCDLEVLLSTVEAWKTILFTGMSNMSELENMSDIVENAGGSMARTTMEQKKDVKMPIKRGQLLQEKLWLKPGLVPAHTGDLFCRCVDC